MNLDLFTSFNGRSNRQPFWLGLLVLIIISTILQFILFGIFGASMMGSGSEDPTVMMQEMSKMMVPLGILLLITLWPTLALYAKRWHDRDKSGWWSLIMLIPFIGGIWMLIELGFLRGTDGPNRFGQDPLADR
jgi:uncharacterized membrane protein YhaH (DUF805 family)